MSDLRLAMDAEVNEIDIRLICYRFNAEQAGAHVVYPGLAAAVPAVMYEGTAPVVAAVLHRGTWRGGHVLGWLWTSPAHRRAGHARTLFALLEAEFGHLWLEAPFTADGLAAIRSIAEDYSERTVTVRGGTYELLQEADR